MIKDTLLADQLSAMKSKDSSRLQTLRYILAQIKNKEIDKKASLTDEETVGIIRKQVKEIEESIEAFKKGNRDDLVVEHEAKRELTASYLPPEISDEELAAAIDELKEQYSEAYQKNPKTLIGICMKELRQKASPARIMKALGE